MKRFSFFAFFLAALFAFGTELYVNGTFRDLGGNGFPKKWLRNSWSGYEPACRLEVIPFGGLMGNSLKMSNIQSKNGAAVNTDFYPGLSGDTARISFRARGKGKGKVQMYFKTLTGEWNFMSDESVAFSLTPEWRFYTASLPVKNGKAGETGSFDMAIEMEKGAEIEFSDYTVDLIEGKYRGEVVFPDKWVAFGPVSNDFMPEDFDRIPKEIEGKAGVPMKRVARMFDMGELLTQELETGWLFAEVESPIECNYSVGCGADWWMQFYVNGQIVIDTTETGNDEAVYDITNHVATAWLQKGKNILAIKLIRGKNSAVVKAGGALELGAPSLKLKVNHLEWIEDFNGEEVTCTGNPELITGYPAPGLLTPTGQGVFQCFDSLRIEPPLKALEAVERRDSFRVIGVRLQDFGEKDTNGNLSLVFQDAGEEFRLGIENDVMASDLKLRIFENGAILAEKSCPKNALPAEILFGGDAFGRYSVMVTSLSGGSNLEFAGETNFFSSHKSVKPYLLLEGNDSIVTLDNFFLGRAQEKSPFSTAPFIVKPQEEFDPVAAGWKLVFDDEFDGDDIDWEKWKPAWNHTDGYYSVKDGILAIKADWEDKSHKKLLSSSIKTRTTYLYGYFEWRGRFKRQSGWWSAFWLYGETNSNPFFDGFEIDIYEDYYLAAMEKGKPARGVLDHNLHIYVADVLKSWNYNGPKLPDLDGYYTVGCKWTPFEISYYLDGKLIKSQANHSPYDSVVFDAFNHNCGVTPLEVIVSSQVNRKSGGPASLGTYPDYFYTDYVRVYEYPHDEDPQIEWTSVPEGEVAFACVGDKLKFSAEVTPNADTQSPIKNVYLFDSGALVDYKSEPPYDFEVLLTKEFFDTTDYVRPGRQNEVPNFMNGLHSYVIFAQDERGNVAHTDAWTLYGIFDGKPKYGTPYKGVAAQIPGVVELVKFDEGGEGVAYHDNTPENLGSSSGFRTDEGVDCSSSSIGYVASGEWTSYTVDVAEAGTYEVEFVYGTVNTIPGKTALMLDDFQPLGAFEVYCKPGENMHWGCDKSATTRVELPAGRHVIRLYFLYSLNAAQLKFTKVD